MRHTAMKAFERRLQQLEERAEEKRRRHDRPAWWPTPEEAAVMFREKAGEWRARLGTLGVWDPAWEPEIERYAAEVRLHGFAVVEEFRRWLARWRRAALEAEDTAMRPMLAEPADTRGPVATIGPDHEEDDEAPIPARMRRTTPRAASSPYVIGGERHVYTWRDPRPPHLK